MAEQTNQLRDALVEFMRLRCDGTFSNQDPEHWNLELTTATVDADNTVPAFIDALAAHLQDHLPPANAVAQARVGLTALTEIASLPAVRSDECSTVALTALKEISDLDTLAPCEQDTYQNGKLVAWIDGGKMSVQGMVDEANRWTENKMDWHYVGGRAVIKTLGEPVDALKALERALPRFL